MERDTGAETEVKRRKVRETQGERHWGKTELEKWGGYREIRWKRHRTYRQRVRHRVAERHGGTDRKTQWEREIVRETEGDRKG
jgi:hypothetical protein